MNNMRFKKAIANKVVDAAVQMVRLPNQSCIWLCGKPNTKIDVSLEEYENLKNFIKRA